MTAMLRLMFCLFLLLASATDAGPTTQPIVYREEVRQNPPMHLHIVQIDLTDQRISLHAVRAGGVDPDGDGPWQTTLAPTSTVARRENFAVAINANYFTVKEKRKILGVDMPYFNGNWAKVVGWAVTRGEVVSSEIYEGGLAVLATGEVKVGPFQKIPAGTVEGVAGTPALVIDGKVNSIRDDDPAPHTGIGLDRDGKLLTFIVVDGRRPDYSAGLTLKQFAEEFTKLNCYNAVGMDGGGSSTLVMRSANQQSWVVKNRPSDGHNLWGDPSFERSVAFVLGVKFDETGKDAGR